VGSFCSIFSKTSGTVKALAQVNPRVAAQKLSNLIAKPD
jgi:hypothetical protein